jgi:hypothetical protein
MVYIKSRYVRDHVKEQKEERCCINVHSRKSVLMNKISEFFEKESHLQELLSIISGDSTLSLRVIDFFVTNYSRKNEAIYEIGDESFMVHHSYKSQLKAYSKKQFDPFCRRERIIFFVEEFAEVPPNEKNGETVKAKETKKIRELAKIKTTVGQLNFFRWAIKNKVLLFIKNNQENIEKEMNKSHKKGKNHGKLRQKMKIIRKKDKIISGENHGDIENEKQKMTKAKNTKGKETKKQNEVVTERKNSKAKTRNPVEEKSEFILETKKYFPYENQSKIPRENIKLSATKKVNKHNVTITVKFGSK